MCIRDSLIGLPLEPAGIFAREDQRPCRLDCTDDQFNQLVFNDIRMRRIILDQNGSKIFLQQVLDAIEVTGSDAVSYTHLKTAESRAV